MTNGMDAKKMAENARRKLAAEMDKATPDMKRCIFLKATIARYTKQSERR